MQPSRQNTSTIVPRGHFDNLIKAVPVPALLVDGACRIPHSKQEVRVAAVLTGPYKEVRAQEHRPYRSGRVDGLGANKQNKRLCVCGAPAWRNGEVMQ